jgi:hypothetical protein
MQVEGLYWGEGGAAIVGGGDLRSPLEVSFQLIGESYPSTPSCARSEDVVQFAEVVEAGCRNGEVEVPHFSGEQCELSGR